MELISVCIHRKLKRKHFLSFEVVWGGKKKFTWVNVFSPSNVLFIFFPIKCYIIYFNNCPYALVTSEAPCLRKSKSVTILFWFLVSGVLFVAYLNSSNFHVAPFFPYISVDPKLQYKTNKHFIFKFNGIPNV